MNRKYLSTALLTIALTVTTSCFVWADAPKEATETKKETPATTVSEPEKKSAPVAEPTVVPVVVKPADDQVVVEDASMGELTFQRLDKALDMCISPSLKRIRVSAGISTPKKIRAIQVEKRIFSLNPMDDYSTDKNDYNEIVSGTVGNDKFDLGPGNDVVYGGNGDDILIGGTGSDTFVFNGTFGSDTIYDRATGLYRNGDVNTLIFGDLKSSDVKFAKTENALVIQSATVETNKVIIVGFFAGDDPIQSVKFMDTTLTAEDLREKVK